MKKKFSLLLTLVCCLVLSLALVGCGGDAQGENPEGVESETVLMFDKEELNVAVCDDEVCTLSVVGRVTDHQGDSGYLVDCVNKTDADIYVCASADTYVGGEQLFMDGGSVVPAGETVEDIYLYFYGSDLENGIESLVDVEISIDVWVDAEEPTELLGTYPASL